MADQNNKNVDALAQEITLKAAVKANCVVHLMDGRAHHRAVSQHGQHIPALK